MGRMQQDPLNMQGMVSRSNAEQLTDMVVAVLRAGVMAAAAVVSAGLVFLVVLHRGETASFSQFHGHRVPIHYGLVGVFDRSIHRRAPRDIIDLGLVILILTPVARVLFSAVVYLYEKDVLYLAITAAVLIVLMVSLVGG